MKRLIIAADGTWNDLEMRYITNVGRLVQALSGVGKTAEGNEIPQLVFYDDGVGADAAGARRFLEGGFGLGIDNLIYEAYRFISVNWEPGDEICLFGFSRGAYTVRSVAGMLGTVGLVTRKKLKDLPEAMEAYRSKNPEKQRRFKEEVADADPDEVKVTLLGCWDTVGALGIPDKIPWLPLDRFGRERFGFHNTELGSHIERALHAVSIDEPRKEFDVTPMNKTPGSRTKLVQHWFPGDHGCVGGGTWEKRGLSNRCLWWMVDQAKALGVDLGADLKSLHDRAVCDHRIFYLPNTNFFYSRKERSLDKVKWSDIDASAGRRVADLGASDSRASQKFLNGFASKLKNLPKSPDLWPSGRKARLAPGDSTCVRAFARSRDAGSGLLVEAGDRYAFEVARTQVWKDGGLDACDVRGWNTKKDKTPYENGRKADLGSLKSRMIKWAGNKKLVRGADWFELVAGVEALGIPAPKGKTDPHVATYAPGATGELFFAANDLASHLDLIDKYDNNQGWVWVKVTRVA